MKTLLAFAFLLGLAACGADGEPVAPTKPGISVSGDVRIGVAG